MRWFWLVAAVAGCDGSFGPGATTNPGTTVPAPGGIADVVDAVVASDALVDSCGDMLLAISDPGDTRLLYLTIGGDLAEAARLSSKPVEASFTLPHDDVEVVALWGAHLRDAYGCNDVLYEEPVIEGRGAAISGTVSVVVETHKGATEFQPYAMVDVELLDVELEDEAGETAVLEALELVDQFIGWFPG